jgi:hypothetical protein
LSSTRVAKEFFYAARDVLLLYKAIVPVQVCARTNYTVIQIVYTCRLCHIIGTSGGSPEILTPVVQPY